MRKYQSLLTGLAVVLILTSHATKSSAQRRPNTKFIPYSSVTFGAGSSHYYGDLAGYARAFRATYIMPRWNVGLGYTRQFTPHFAARAMFTWARIAGDDYTFNKNNVDKYIVQYARNLHFRNDLKEFAVTGIYNFVADGRNANVRAKFTPYLFGGVALVAHSPEARTPAVAEEAAPYETRKWVKLQPLHTEGQGQPGRDKPYSLVTVAIPVGIGARYQLNELFNVGFEIGYRYTFTDYLDDVGGAGYGDPALREGLATKMADRRFQTIAARKANGPDRYAILKDMFTNGTPAQQSVITDALQTSIRGGNGVFQDGYLLTNLSIQYVIPGKIKCPPIK
jgi:Outer membrane protein beta-barrel domain